MSRRIRFAAAGLAALLLLGSLVWLDRGTLQHANRLYREGQTERAEELYRGRSRAARAGASTLNLGTALLERGDPDSEQHLLDAAMSADRRIQQRARYNLGYDYLSRLDPSLEADSAKRLADASIAQSRAALRIDRDDEDALWNLALARRMRDSLERVEPERMSQGGEDEMPIERLALTRSGAGQGESGMEPMHPPPPAGETGDRSGAANGAREAFASDDPGPLTEAQLLELLRSVHDDPELLIRGILWSRRPDVAWWNSEPYPGGNR